MTVCEEIDAGPRPRLWRVAKLLLFCLTEKVDDEKYPEPIIEEIFMIVGSFPCHNNGNGSGEGEREPELRSPKDARLQDEHE